MNLDTVKESIIYGSTYEAIISGIITSNDILNYLLITDISNNNMMAYRALCHFCMDQIVENDDPKQNGKPFITLTIHDEYVAIYSLSISIINPGRNDNERLKIGKSIQKVLPKLITVNEFSKNIHLICDSIHLPIELTLTDIWMIVRSRSMKLMTINYRLINGNVNTWISNDYVIPLSDISYEFYEKMLLERCHLLKKVAPVYWHEVGIKIYRPIVEINIKLSDKNREEIKTYADIFPGLIPNKLINQSDLSYYINQLTNIQQAYVLGYPIHKYVPTQDIIDRSINLIGEIGIDKYCENITQQNLKNMNNHGEMINPLSLNENIIISNEQNVLTENICDYSSFDVIRYYIDSHVYFFTRPEFSKIITSKKNVWTNEPVPITILNEINNRMEINIVNDLPRSLPLRELLLKTEQGKIIEKIPKPIIPNISPAQVSANINLMNNMEESDDDYYENEVGDNVYFRVSTADGRGIIYTDGSSNIEELENFLTEHNIDYEYITGVIRDGVFHNNETEEEFHILNESDESESYEDYEGCDNEGVENDQNENNHNELGRMCPGCGIVHEFDSDDIDSDIDIDVD